MTADYPTDEVAATPEYVLDVYKDWHRIGVAAGETYALPLSFETPLWEWEDSLQIESWGHGGFRGSVNATWDIDIPIAEWRTWERTAHTLGDLCRLIAARVTMHTVRPWDHIAGRCLPAGAFLTVRAMLANAGANPEHITPSAPLAQYLAGDRNAFWMGFARSFPGLGPVPAYPRLVQNLGRCVSVLGLPTLMGVLALAIAGPAGSWPAPLVTLIVLGLGVWLLKQSSVFWEFSDSNIRTFRDLAYALAGQQPRRRIQPSP